MDIWKLKIIDNHIISCFNMENRKEIYIGVYYREDRKSLRFVLSFSWGAEINSEENITILNRMQHLIDDFSEEYVKKGVSYYWEIDNIKTEDKTLFINKITTLIKEDFQIFLNNK